MNVTARFTTAVEIEAENAEQAEEIAREKYKSGEIKFDFDDRITPWFDAVPLSISSPDSK